MLKEDGHHVKEIKARHSNVKDPPCIKVTPTERIVGAAFEISHNSCINISILFYDSNWNPNVSKNFRTI